MSLLSCHIDRCRRIDMSSSYCCTDRRGRTVSPYCVIERCINIVSVATAYCIMSSSPHIVSCRRRHISYRIIPAAYPLYRLHRRIISYRIAPSYCVVSPSRRCIISHRVAPSRRRGGEGFSAFAVTPLYQREGKIT